MTAIDRRRFLSGVGAGFGAGSLLFPLGHTVAAAGPACAAFLSARGDGHGHYFVSGFDRHDQMAFDLALPARGHSLACDPAGRRAVAFGRRPETFAVVLDLRTGRIEAAFHSPTGRHFFGHGVFSPDGRLLYATENDYDGQRGVIGVYDVGGGFRRVSEFSSHGIGPHEVRMMPDGETLAIANGAILTHPSMSRVKLNLPTMKPNLALVDRRSGTLRRRTELRPDLHQASIRHLSIARDGRVAVGMQYQGPAGDPVPLVAIVAPDGRVRLCDRAPGPTRAMRQYCGSVEFDRTGAIVATSSPRGGVVAFWDASTGGCLASARVTAGCGLAALTRPGRFLVTGGAGAAAIVDAKSGGIERFPAAFPATAHWDNHIVRTPLLHV